MSKSDPPLTDQYFTIESRTRAEQKVQGSKFIATAVPVLTREQALEELDVLQREFFDATHNCFAFRIGIHGLEFRAADDGEPSGTAGKPILFAIQKYAVSDILIVVTRYFGGTKLGRGGLARAYASSAELVLGNCIRKPVYKTRTVKVFCTYEDIKLILPLIEKSAVYFTSDYRDAVEFSAKVLHSNIQSFTDSVTSLTNARAGFVLEDED